MIYKNIELEEVSEETFDDVMDKYRDPLAIPVDFDDEEDDIIQMAAYESRGTGTLLGVMKITIHGTIYYIAPEFDVENAISEREVYERIYGA